MREFKLADKVFIKSSNTTTKIFNRYLYCLIPFLLLIVAYNLIWGSKIYIINLVKSLSISLVVCLLVQYIFNIIKKEKNINRLFFEDNILTISIILGLCSINSSILVIAISSLMTIVMKNILKNVTVSSVLYGLLVILLSSYLFGDLNTPLTNLRELGYVGSYTDVVKAHGSIIDYLLGINTIYLSPVLTVLSFFYLFYKKSIKYNIINSYILTVSFIMLFFGIFNGMNIWYVCFQMVTGNILFLAIFCLGDYPNTPITWEGQVLYGTILGIVTSVLRFITPELSVIITLILGPIILTKIIDKISFKLRHDKKSFHVLLSILIFIVLVTTIILNILI